MRNVIPMCVAKVGYVFISVLYCFLGIWMMVRPGAFAMWAGSLLGIGTIAFGIIRLVGYFSKDLFRLAFQHDLALGILLEVMGIMILIHPDVSMSVLCSMLGIAVLVESMLRLQVALDAERFGITKWWLLLALAVLTGIVGVLMVFRPWESTTAITILIGCGLLMNGILNLVVAICTVKIVPNQKKEFKEE